MIVHRNNGSSWLIMPLIIPLLLILLLLCNPSLMDKASFQSSLFISKPYGAESGGRYLLKDKSSILRPLDPISFLRHQRDSYLYTANANTSAKDSKNNNNDDKERKITIRTPLGEPLSPLTRTPPVYMADIYKGLRHALYTEVPSVGKLKHRQILALTNLFGVLHRYLPFDNENPRRFVKRMYHWLKPKTQSMDTTLPSNRLLAAMRVGSEGYLPMVTNYVGCAGSINEYLCSFWILFHVLTVNEFWSKQARKEAHITSAITNNVNKIPSHSNATNNATTAISLSPSPLSSTEATKLKAVNTQLNVDNGNNNNSDNNKPEVLFAMRDYVENFFVCQHCKENFTRLSQYLENQIDTPEMAVKWLWKTHNLFNSRLNNPDHSKRPYPYPELCPHCYISVDRKIYDQSTLGTKMKISITESSHRLHHHRNHNHNHNHQRSNLHAHIRIPSMETKDGQFLPSADSNLPTPSHTESTLSRISNDVGDSHFVSHHEWNHDNVWQFIVTQYYSENLIRHNSTNGYSTINRLLLAACIVVIVAFQVKE